MTLTEAINKHNEIMSKVCEIRTRDNGPFTRDEIRTLVNLYAEKDALARQIVSEKTGVKLAPSE